MEENILTLRELVFPVADTTLLSSLNTFCKFLNLLIHFYYLIFLLLLLLDFDVSGVLKWLLSVKELSKLWVSSGAPVTDGNLNNGTRCKNFRGTTFKGKKNVSEGYCNFIQKEFLT